MIPVGSNFRVSNVDLAVTPKPWKGGSASYPGLTITLSRPTHQRHIRHVVHHHTLMLRRVLCYPSKMRFDDVVAVQERQLPGGLDPDLQ